MTASYGGDSNYNSSVSAAGSSASLAGNTLTLTLNVMYMAGLLGNRVVWVAGRDTAGANNTDWQALGTWTVQ